MRNSKNRPQKRQKINPQPPRLRLPEPAWERPADVNYICGATGSGKTFFTRERLARHAGPVLVWDWKQEFREVRATARTVPDLARMAAQYERVRYVPDMKNVPAQFDYFCRIAWTRQQHKPRDNLLFIVEELSEVTQPSRAPDWWRRIIVQGRVYGFSIIGTTQRPAFVDKSFETNASFIRCGRLLNRNDAQTMARIIGVKIEQISTLPDRAAFEFDGRQVRRV